MLRHVSKIDIANEWLINRKYSIGITVETENILKIHVYHQTNQLCIQTWLSAFEHWSKDGTPNESHIVNSVLISKPKRVKKWAQMTGDVVLVTVQRLTDEWWAPFGIGKCGYIAD